jgi:hypothetical protein
MNAHDIKLKDAVFTVIEGFNIPPDVRKILETAYYATAPAHVQEPLGFMNAGHVHEMQQGRLPYGYIYPKGSVGADVAIYTAVLPWVGLTDDEIMDMYNEPRSDAEMIAFGRKLEAKLKDKNYISK